jgi:hypothetical protein
VKTLYLFSHLPKTGGAALFQNVERSLPCSKRLRLNYTHKQFYFDPRTEKLCFYEKDEDFTQLLESLSEKDRSQIEFASGHDLPYGLHHHFVQDARYFMFVREPVARTVSLYNYQRSQHDFLQEMKNMDESHYRLQQHSREWFLIGGKVPSFEKWLEESYNQNYHFYFTMTRTLQQFGYLDSEIQEGSWERCLEKFYFVGLTETIHEDGLYLYHEMGTRRFWANRNASHPHIRYRELAPQTQERIREKNQLDFILYEHAKKANAAFKRQRSDFARIVRYMGVRRKGAFVQEKIWPSVESCLRSILRPVRSAYASRR